MGRYQEGAAHKSGDMAKYSLAEGKSPHVQRMRPVYHSLVQAFVLGNLAPGELSQHFGYTTGQVSRILGSPAVQAEIARLMETKVMVEVDMAKDIQMMKRKSLQVLDEDLEMDPVTLDHRKVRQNVALKILGLDGKGVQVNFNQFNDQRRKAAEELNVDDIRSEVLELTRGPSGDYEIED